MYNLLSIFKNLLLGLGSSPECPSLLSLGGIADQLGLLWEELSPRSGSGIGAEGLWLLGP